MAKEKLVDADHIFYVPLDFKHVVRKFFKTLKPSVFVLAESELWPNLLREAKVAFPVFSGEVVDGSVS